MILQISAFKFSVSKVIAVQYDGTINTFTKTCQNHIFGLQDFD